MVLASMLVPGACSSTAKGHVTLEARGAVAFGHDPNKFQADDLASAQGTGISTGPGISGDGLPDPSFKGRGVGVQAAIDTAIVDLIGGVERRHFEDTTVPETSIGLRKRFGPMDGDYALYAFFLARDDQRGKEPGSGFNGISFGIGLLGHISDHWFLDWNLGWERTGHLTIEPGHSRRQEGVMQFGLGYAF